MSASAVVAVDKRLLVAVCSDEASQYGQYGNWLVQAMDIETGNVTELVAPKDSQNHTVACGFSEQMKPGRYDAASSKLSGQPVLSAAHKRIFFTVSSPVCSEGSSWVSCDLTFTLCSVGSRAGHLKDDPTWCSPLPAGIVGDATAQVVVVDDVVVLSGPPANQGGVASMYAFDAQTGARRWVAPLTGATAAALPTALGDRGEVLWLMPRQRRNGNGDNVVVANFPKLNVTAWHIPAFTNASIYSTTTTPLTAVSPTRFVARANQ